MTTRYVGIGGSDANNGTSWATRKLTLNGAEDTPVAAGDAVYVGPGVYRETLSIDVSGSAGNLISYIGDVDGSHTDGVGGLVRITGSDDDISATRANCVAFPGSRSYRLFQGFYMDTTTGVEFATGSGITYTTIQDCIFMPCPSNNCITLNGSTPINNIIRRCLIFAGRGYAGILFSYVTQVNDSSNLVENCTIVGGANSIILSRIAGVLINNCTFLCQAASTTSGAIQIQQAYTGGQISTVTNCIIQSCGVGVYAVNVGDLVENYNSFYANATDRSNVNTGANSNSYPALLNAPLLLSGFKFPWSFGELSKWSQVKAIAGSGESSEDYFGELRPATSAKKSRGAVQYVGANRSSVQAHAGSYSLCLSDAGRHQIWIPTSNVSTVFSVWVYFEADYTGTKPQMVIKQPGVSDTTIVATGAVSTWELLTTTLTPSTAPGYVIMELVSNNTATSTNFKTYFDDWSAL